MDDIGWYSDEEDVPLSPTSPPPASQSQAKRKNKKKNKQKSSLMVSELAYARAQRDHALRQSAHTYEQLQAARQTVREREEHVRTTPTLVRERELLSRVHFLERESTRQHESMHLLRQELWAVRADRAVLDRQLLQLGRDPRYLSDVDLLSSELRRRTEVMGREIQQLERLVEQLRETNRGFPQG